MIDIEHLSDAEFDVLATRYKTSVRNSPARAATRNPEAS